MVGEELNAEFDNSDIGVESFGFYKIDISTSSSLKSREYLARGCHILVVYTMIL